MRQHRFCTLSDVAPTALLVALVSSIASAVFATDVTLRRFSIESPDAAQLAETLEAEGFDVMHGPTAHGTLEVVATDDDFHQLSLRGLNPVLVEIGRPLREILDERRAIDPGYLDGDQIIAELYAVEAAFPDIARVVDVTAEYGMPATFEGRHLYALKLSDNVLTREDEHAFLMVSAHHCREIVTPVIALDAIDRLTSGYGNDATITSLIDSHEIWVAPLWNPDGYNTVFTADNLWRKNRRVLPTAIGVDLNRNYDFGWASSCGGSSTETSSTYRGPSAASEPETQTMVALSRDQRFAQVLDYHSSGREVLFSYRTLPAGAPCALHPWDAYHDTLAEQLSQTSSYAGQRRPPSAHGEHYEWQLLSGAEAFLTETATEFQPPHADALAEAAAVWPGTLWLLQKPVPLTGHVVDACDGTPLVADVDFPDVAFTEGEQHTSFLPFGRYHAFPPAGVHRVRFNALGYTSDERFPFITDGVTATEEVALVPSAGCSPVCGNGAVESGEQCDDGNTVPGDGCRDDCTVEACGDGILDPNEECDDGNSLPGDGCRADCTVEACGDGILDPDEECDDGNTSDDDGCHSDCTIETCLTSTLTRATQLVCVELLPLSVACSWVGDPNASQHHLNAVDDKVLLLDPRRFPGNATAECEALVGESDCSDDDGLAASRLFYQVLAACGANGTEEGPF